MRTIKHYLACCALVSCAAAVPLESAAQYDHGKENTLRIATYNIYNGKTVDAKSYNYDKQAGIIESINPDIIAIEEVDSASARSNNRYALVDLDNGGARVQPADAVAHVVPFEG